MRERRFETQGQEEGVLYGRGSLKPLPYARRELRRKTNSVMLVQFSGFAPGTPPPFVAFCPVRKSRSGIGNLARCSRRAGRPGQRYSVNGSGSNKSPFAFGACPKYAQMVTCLFQPQAGRQQKHIEQCE